jgi:nicotinamide-nucleotide amidase
MSETLDVLSNALGERLKVDRLRVVVAESCTGGWLAKVVTDIPGSSDWLDRGFVVYSNAAKREMLGVDADLLARDGAVSESVARAMAAGALVRSDAQVAVAITGIAGPGGGSEDKPVGTVWFAWALGAEQISAQRVQFAGDREEVRHQSVRVALERLLELLGPGV